MPALPNPFYYLDNFRTVLAWLAGRYDDLLSDDERRFVAGFGALPAVSQALLVRMVMRKGELFRASKLRYAEIGDAGAAAVPLVEAGWLDAQPELTLPQLFGLFTLGELAEVFGTVARGARKAELLARLAPEHVAARRLADWWPTAGDTVYCVSVDALCERLRLMFFGNLRQAWSEFVLADLGIYRYEPVPLAPSSRGFQTRQDIDDYLHLHRCRERLAQGEAPEALFADIPATALDNAWLEARRARLLFQLAQQHEKARAWPAALALYQAIRHPGARGRAIRMLERCERYADALALAEAAALAPESEAESQQLGRIMPRLRRQLGLARLPAPASAAIGQFELSLPQPAPGVPVEQAVLAHLRRPEAPVHYVENTLINSLFGLLCWDAIFAPVPGAFFHPFHSGPADLLAADFAARRVAQFDACFALLDSGAYREVIRQRYRDKFNTQSPFVYWGVLDEALLALALDCLPASHLRLYFRRLMADIGTNRAGLPDLIQFWPAERRYRLVEVKGPGDRLQDNQIRWLHYCIEHGMPVSVCYVQWADAAP
ncbi:VRR-NUC domain-containing protein [Chitinivorax sp. PXF-14]|uniref:VRR-NUC domain-containing protein n=1 Tax=Chitinivorax sp. PXF-14 TaxID=3230488 RepID=UPI00346681D0